jgi:hypothetical protein
MSVAGFKAPIFDGIRRTCAVGRVTELGTSQGVARTPYSKV